MIEFIKKQKESIALVCDVADRLYRSFKEVEILEELRTAGKLTIHFLRENQVLDSKTHSAQLMAYQMFVLMATAYANSISDNVKRGFSEKRRNGESLGHVPIGYLTKDGEVTVDPFKSILVRELFEEYSMGLISIPELAYKYGKRGLTTSRNNKTISKSQVDRMITNPFYYGFIEDIDEDGNPIERPHKYEKLITKELFDKCQDIKYNRGYHKYKRTYQDFVFNGLITCCKCDVAYSSYVKKRNIYLHPTKKKTECGHITNIAEAKLLPQVVETIKSIEFPEAVLQEIKEALVASIDVQYKEHSTNITSLNKELERVRQSISNWNRRCAEDMSITTEERTQVLTPLRQEQANYEYQLSIINDADKRFEITLDVLLDLASQSYTLFESSQTHQKQQILKILFANLKLDGKTPYVTLAKPFDKFANWSEFRTWSG